MRDKSGGVRSAAVRHQLLYRHALGEMRRFIDVTAECDGEMIRQKLEVG